mgnify:CR=1 FL=1
MGEGKMIEHELPTVRIQKIVLENFKSFDYVEIEMACGRHFVPCDTESDIRSKRIRKNFAN